MRFSTTIDTFNGPGKNGRQNEITAAYRGTTTDATPTELFIDGTSPRRLVPDFPSGGVLKVLVAGYNATDNAVSYAELVVSFFVSAAGVISLTDQDGVTAGSQDNPLVAITTAGTRAGALNNNVAADFGASVDVVAASGATPAYLRLRVRGSANKTFLWEAFVSGLEVTVTGA